MQHRDYILSTNKFTAAEIMWAPASQSGTEMMKKKMQQQQKQNNLTCVFHSLMLFTLTGNARRLDETLKATDFSHQQQHFSKRHKLIQ